MKQDPNFYIWPLSVILTIKLQTWDLRETHWLMMVNISANFSAKLFQNISNRFLNKWAQIEAWM